MPRKHCSFAVQCLPVCGASLSISEKGVDRSLVDLIHKAECGASYQTRQMWRNRDQIRAQEAGRKDEEGLVMVVLSLQGEDCLLQLHGRDSYFQFHEDIKTLGLVG